MRKIKRLNHWRKEHPTEVWMILAFVGVGLSVKKDRKIHDLTKEIKYWRGYERTIHQAVREGAKLVVKEDILTGQTYIDIVSKAA